MATVPWKEFLHTYNSMKKTNYKSVKEWMSTLYAENGKHVGPLVKITGVGHQTITKYLGQWGILERKPKGGNNYLNRPPGKKEQLFLAIPDKTFAELTRYQIAARCGMSIERFCVLNRKHKRPYRKLVGREQFLLKEENGFTKGEKNEIHCFF